jgi:hypothetical protein
MVCYTPKWISGQAKRFNRMPTGISPCRCTHAVLIVSVVVVEDNTSVKERDCSEYF